MISVIIPTLNEQRALPATLARVFAQTAEFELLVVDGGSTDHTLELLQQEPRLQLLTAPTGRASQMNAGAVKARGEWLLFLHADTLLPPDGLTQIAQLPADVLSGGFQHQFSGQAWGLQLVSWLHNFRCRRTRVFYGDQAMFIRSSLFHELGGFPDEPILEDLLFGERVATITRPVILGVPVITDSRKFEQQGIWLSLWRVLVILLRHELHLPVPARKFFSPVR